MESSVSDSQWYCGNKCTVVDMESGYDGHALSIIDRSEEAATLQQDLNCRDLALLNGQRIFARSFFQFPTAHEEFNVVTSLKIQGSSLSKNRFPNFQFTIPASSEDSDTWYAVYGDTRLNVPEFDTFTPEQLDELTCGIQWRVKDAAIANFNIDHVFVMPKDDLAPLMPSITKGWVINGGLEYNTVNTYWTDPTSEWLSNGGNFEVITASDAPEGESYARVFDRAESTSSIGVKLQIPDDFDDMRWIQVRYWAKFSYKDAASDAAATGEDRHHYLNSMFRLTYDSQGFTT